MDWEPCIKILSWQKFRLSYYNKLLYNESMIKVTVKRTGVTEKHCSTFALFSNGFHPQTDKVNTSKRLTEGRIKGGGSVTTKTTKIVKIIDLQKFHPRKFEYGQYFPILFGDYDNTGCSLVTSCHHHALAGDSMT